MTSSLNIPPHVGSCLKRAISLHDRGDAAGALEAIAAGAVADIQQHQQAFLGDVRACVMMGDFAAEVLRSAGLQGCSVAQTCHHVRDDCAESISSPSHKQSTIRVLYVVPNLAQGQAASMNLLRLVESHLESNKRMTPGRDASRFDVQVMICEEFTQRTPPLAFLQDPRAASDDVGGALLAGLRSLATVHVLSTRGTYLDAAREGLQFARSFSPNLALFMGNLSCPVQTAMAFARIAPVQACLNIGVPLVVQGIDAIIYNNPRKRVRDEAVFSTRGIRVLGVETSGGDAAGGVHAPAVLRSALGVPQDASVLVSVSNRLTHRMLAGEFAKHLALFLQQNQGTWWIGVGPGEPAPVLDVIRDAGSDDAARRCVFAGPHRDVRGVVKACDVFLNEYPEGGGNSVIEAMGCGIPVVAMRAGERHAECIGAELVGQDAIQSRDIDAYWQLVREWACDKRLAKLAGQRQQQRALEKLDYAVICKEYEKCIQTLASDPRSLTPQPVLVAGSER